MPFYVSLHRVTVLVSDPAGRAASSVEHAPIRRDARNPLDNGIPGDMGGRGDNWRVGSIHHHHMAIAESIYEVGGGG